MLSFISVLLTSLLAGFAAAQNSTSSFNPGSVDLTTRNQWCNGERNNCPYLCGGPMNLKTNTCDGEKLEYMCICANNNSAPANIADYLDTLPNHICQQQFEDCRNQNPGSQACKTCGTLKATDVPKASISSTAAASSSAAPTSGSSGTAAPAPSATGSSGAGRIEGTVGGLAAGVIAAVLL